MNSLRNGTVCTVLAMLGVLGSLTAEAATSKQRVAAAPRRVVCGITGCFEVPPGCRHEMRAAGRGGVVAVIICDRAR
mgnify:FL=1